MSFFVPSPGSYVKIVMCQTIQVEGFVESWNNEQVILVSSSKDYLILDPKQINLIKVINNQHQGLSRLMDTNNHSHIDTHAQNHYTDEQPNDLSAIANDFDKVLKSDMPQKEKNMQLALLKKQFNKLERKLISEKLKSNNIDTSANYTLPGFFKK